MMRVCIITTGAVGTNPRVVKEAQALCDMGDDVIVISTRTLSRIDSWDESVLTQSTFRVRRLDFRRRRVRWPHRLKQIACARAFPITGEQWFAERGMSPFTGSLIAAAKQVPADLYIAHYPPALPAAAIAARQHGAAYAFDAEDFHLGEWPEDREHEAARSLLGSVEDHYLSGCAYITAASPEIADAYARSYPIERPSVVLNVFPRTDGPAAPMPAGTVTPRPSVYWFSQTIGAGRGLECAVVAIALARTRPHLYLRGSPDPEFLGRLRGIAADAGVADRLHILPVGLPHEMVRLASAYDIGFSGEPGHTSNNRSALGNKLFTYILAGIPVIMSDVPAHQAFAARDINVGRLYNAEKPESLAAAFDSILGDPVVLAIARETAYRLGQTRFNWDIEKANLMGLITDCAHVQHRSKQQSMLTA